MLSWIAVQLQHEDIENDLAQRTAQALKHGGLGWAVPYVSGRDVILTGKAPEDRGPMLATAYARNVWGVRTAYDRAGLIAQVADYRWTATSDGAKRLKLVGDVPSERARRALLGAAKAAFPSAAVTDDMKLARGTIDRDAWLAGAEFSLKTLSTLKNGEAQLASLDLSMRGEAATSQAYRDVRAALANRRPGGVNLAHGYLAAGREALCVDRQERLGWRRHFWLCTS